MRILPFALAFAWVMGSSFALAQSSGMSISVLPRGTETKPKPEEPKTTSSATPSDNPTNALTDNRVKNTTGTPVVQSGGPAK